MTLFNSRNPRIAAAQAHLIETLTGIPDEYGAADVVNDYQADLMAAVRTHTRQQAIEHTARLLNKPGRKGRRRQPANVVDLAERRSA